MCGRFTLKTPAAVLIEHFDLGFQPTDELPLFDPRYNIAPTQNVAVVRAGADHPGRQAASLRWGLVPSWAKDLSVGNRMINARCETVAEKPSFRNAWRKRRCLIAVDGFFEWKKLGKQKQPYYIHRGDEQPFAFAGLWERWQPKEGGDPVETCTIITTEANDLMSNLHERMPVILSPDVYDVWLDEGCQDTARLTPLLVPYPLDDLTAQPVSTHVNRPINDDPQCIQPAENTHDED